MQTFVGKGNMIPDSHLGLPPEVISSVANSSRLPLSTDGRKKLVAEFSHSLYRWYQKRSQATRNWNPDVTFDWRSLRRDHSEKLMTIVEGFYAVEQYAPDYTSELVRLTRGGYGHSQFQIRWGAEEEKHADLWRNVLLFGRARTPAQLQDYTNELRANAWVAPFSNPLEMLFYTVFQERATQLIYLKTVNLCRNENGIEDPVLVKAVSTIATDEAAHYDFFLSLARVHLYYFPTLAFEALVKVLRNFIMPAAHIVPNYDAFINELYGSRLFSPGMYGREVVKPALGALGLESVRAVEKAILNTKASPTMTGWPLRSPYSGCNFAVLESTIRSLFDRINRFELDVGLNEISPTVFVPVDE